MNNQMTQQMPGMPGMPGMNYGQAQAQYNGQMVQQGMVGITQDPMGGSQTYNPHVPQTMQQPMGQMQGMGQSQQQEQKKGNFITVIRDNYTTISLFEYSAGYDPTEKFPQAFGFVMGVPSVPDTTKQSGKRYVPTQKIVMKFSTQEIRALGQCMLDIAVFKQAIPAFEKYSDPSKNSYTQNGAQAGATKAFKMSYDQSKNNAIINITYGQQKVFIPIKDLQDLRGLGHSLINCGNFADQKLAEYIMANHIRAEVPEEVPEHIVAGEMTMAQQPGAGMQQQMPPQQYAQPGAGMQQMPAQGMQQMPQQQYVQPGATGIPYQMPGQQG